MAPKIILSKSWLKIIAALLLLICVTFTFLTQAHAHPQDEFCDAAMQIDMELCLQLSGLDSAQGPNVLKDEDGNVRSPLSSALYFAKIGIDHILPGGTDHILFVLALFLAAKTTRSLILQISVFTIAHTVTLGLTAAGVIEPPASIVEPLIALSIAVVAVETLFKSEPSKWRLLIIFGFGLFHGMGFAGFIKEIGLPPEQFWPSLIGFNVGVEIGQLSVILLAVILAWPVKRVLARTNISYRAAVIIPASLIIAAIGFWWFIARSLGL